MPGQWHVGDGFRADERLVSLGESGLGARRRFLETPLTPCCDGDFLASAQSAHVASQPAVDGGRGSTLSLVRGPWTTGRVILPEHRTAVDGVAMLVAEATQQGAHRGHGLGMGGMVGEVHFFPGIFVEIKQ